VEAIYNPKILGGQTLGIKRHVWLCSAVAGVCHANKALPWGYVLPHMHLHLSHAELQKRQHKLSSVMPQAKG